ncbi:MAG: histidine kinase [Kordia sp.]|nr:MAG: histidine kinase [Kordia sp.]
MLQSSFLKHNFGKKTVLTIKVALTCSIMTFLCALLCYYYLDIKGVIFYALLIYSLANLLNLAIFFKHKRLVVTYNVMSFLAFLVTYVTCLYSGGVDSPFSTFLVLIIFSGYATNVFYGNLWFVIITAAVSSLYLIGMSDFKFINYVPESANDTFNYFFLLFLIILLGGVFGRLMSKNNDLVYKSKIEIAKRNEEKTVLLKEIHHRVKNNLQVVNSLLRIQARGIDDENVKLMFKLTQSRVIAMARLHEKIYNTKDLKYIDVNEHFRLLIRDLIHSYNLDKRIVSKFDIEPIKMSIDTLLPLSLIINELVSNSLKHAFRNVDSGELFVELKKVSDLDSRYELVVGDNGVGSKNCMLSDIVSSTGVTLIKTFVRQLNGTIETLKEKTGTNFKISFSDTHTK